MVKRLRDQSQEEPRRFIWRLDARRYFSFHCQTRSRKSSRPRSLALGAFLFELAIDHHLGGDAGVIGARHPQRVVAEHAVPADGHVDERCARACGRCAASR